MGRKIERLTLDHLDQLPGRCGDCVFWELDPVRRDAVRGHEAEEKAAWVSMVLREWGSCGRVALVDGEVVGHMIWAPPVHVPAADGFATAPISTRRRHPGHGTHRAGASRRWDWAGCSCRGWPRTSSFAATSGRSRRSVTPGVAPAIASYRLTSCWPWASPRTGRTRSTRGCGWTCAPRCPSARSWRRGSSRSSAPCAASRYADRCRGHRTVDTAAVAGQATPSPRAAETMAGSWHALAKAAMRASISRPSSHWPIGSATRRSQAGLTA